MTFGIESKYSYSIYKLYNELWLIQSSKSSVNCYNSASWQNQGGYKLQDPPLHCYIAPLVCTWVIFLHLDFLFVQTFYLFCYRLTTTIVKIDYCFSID